MSTQPEVLNALETPYPHQQCPSIERDTHDVDYQYLLDNRQEDGE